MHTIVLWFLISTPSLGADTPIAAYKSETECEQIAQSVNAHRLSAHAHPLKCERRLKTVAEQ